MSTSRRWLRIDGEERGLERSDVVVAVLVLGAVGAGLGLAFLTPSTAIPLGIVEVGGISMSPTFGESGVALYADAGSLEPGEVVVFHDETSGRYIMHRVVGETESGLVTKGDAYGMTDQELGRSYVSEETRVGQVFVVVDSKGVHVPAKLF